MSPPSGPPLLDVDALRAELALLRKSDRRAWLLRLSDMVPRGEISPEAVGGYSAAYFHGPNEAALDPACVAVLLESMVGLLFMPCPEDDPEGAPCGLPQAHQCEHASAAQLIEMVKDWARCMEQIEAIQKIHASVLRKPLACGWCLVKLGPEAGGATFDGDDALRAHVTSCEHSPLVARIAALQDALREATDMAEEGFRDAESELPSKHRYHAHVNAQYARIEALRKVGKGA